MKHVLLYVYIKIESKRRNLFKDVEYLLKQWSCKKFTLKSAQSHKENASKSCFQKQFLSLGTTVWTLAAAVAMSLPLLRGQ